MQYLLKKKKIFGELKKQTIFSPIHLNIDDIEVRQREEGRANI